MIKTHTYKYTLIFLFFLLVSVFSVYSQDSKIEITGVVTDESKTPLIGVNIIVKGQPGLGVITNIDGEYKIKVNPYSFLVFSYVGFDNQEHLIKDDTKTLNVELKESKSTILDEVAVIGTGVQKKVTLTGAVTTVDMGDLKSPTSNIVNALAGNVAGVLARQTSGQPGSDTSEFWIRGISTFGAGKSALILVDGFERRMDDLNIEDIESFTILKDASTTAIYGTRGANGVVLITTKRGNEGKTQVDAKVETTYTKRTFTPKFVDGYTYASLMNEARTTRNYEPIYSDEELHLIQSGLDPDLYPNVDWMNLLLKDGAPTYRATLNVKGGGTNSRYYLSGSYLDQGGMYNVDKTLKDYDTNANYKRWNYRLNMDMDVTSTTLVKVGVAGALEKQNYTGANHEAIWHSLLGYNPVLTPIMYSNGYVPAYGAGNYCNPWVTANQTGYTEEWKNSVQTNITLEQKLDFITKGLIFNFRFGYDTYNYNKNRRVKYPEQWMAERLRDSNGNIVFNRVEQEALLHQDSHASGDRREYLEAELAYSSSFGDHNIGSVLKYTQDKKVNTSSIGGDIMSGIDRRNQSLVGHITYNWKYRYMLDFNFGYNGSENFAKGNKFGFFPAYSGAWNIGEEAFIKDNIEWIDMFKIRYSYGKVGNDDIGKRFPFLPEFNNIKLPTYGELETGYNWGDMDNSFAYNGLTNTILANSSVTWEIAKKHNLGIDLNILNNKFNITVDFFKEKREGIYMTRHYLPQIVGIQGQNPSANLGVVKNKGFDGNFALHQKLGNVDFKLRGNFTYSKNEHGESDQPYSNYPYTGWQGFRVGQNRGLVALGLFKDYEDIRNSPTQTFGEVMPGDIKYKDINGDGKIDDNDIVPIGATVTPNLIYGFGASANWNGFDFNLHFQGSGRSHFFINGFTVYPFSNGEWGNILTDVVKSSRWILEENEDVNAKYPRLSYGGNANNYRASTHWLRNGSYLRLKTLEIGYTIPKQIVNKIHLNNVRVHFVGQNLLTFANFKLWDPEIGSSNGQQYPLGKTFTLGLTLNL